ALALRLLAALAGLGLAAAVQGHRDDALAALGRPAAGGLGGFLGERSLVAAHGVAFSETGPGGCTPSGRARSSAGPRAASCRTSGRATGIVLSLPGWPSQSSAFGPDGHPRP